MNSFTARSNISTDVTVSNDVKLTAYKVLYTQLNWVLCGPLWCTSRYNLSTAKTFSDILAMTLSLFALFVIELKLQL